MKKKNISYLLVLSFLMLLCLIYSNKEVYIAKNLIINLSIVIYPITFLITGLITKEGGIKESKKSLKLTFLIILIFYLITSILCTINSTTNSNDISTSLREVFTPNYFNIYDLTIYYPNLINLFTMLIVFYLSHNIFIILYDICKNYVSIFLTFVIAILISGFIDQMLYVSFTTIFNGLNTKLDLVNYVKNLTANFIITIFTSIILSIIFPIITKKN